MARVVVTGGAGFVGARLVRRLLESGDEVVVVDDLSAGSAAAVPPGARLHRGDVRDPGWAPALEGAERVFHLASPVGVRRAHQQGAAVVRAIVEGGMVVAGLCRERGLPVLFTSSSEVYGRGPTGVDASPRWSYAVGKLAVEHLLLAADAGLPSVHVARLFNVVGPGQRPGDGHVLPTFAGAAAAGRPLPIHGDGGARRVFLHVDDAVDALCLLAATPALAGRPIDVGSDEELSIQALAERVAARVAGATLAHVPAQGVFGPGFVQIDRRLPDLRPLRGMGWAPRHTLDQAITAALSEAGCPS